MMLAGVPSMPFLDLQVLQNGRDLGPGSCRNGGDSGIKKDTKGREVSFRAEKAKGSGPRMQRDSRDTDTLGSWRRWKIHESERCFRCGSLCLPTLFGSGNLKIISVYFQL